MPLAEEDRVSSAAWATLLAAKMDFGVFAPVSLMVFSEERFAELLRRERRFALDIEAEGIRL